MGDLSVKRRKKKSQRPKIIFYAVLFLLVGAVFALRASLWNIKSIEVVGLSSISSEQIAGVVNPMLTGNYYYLFPKRSLLFYPDQEIGAALLSTFAGLNSVSLKADFKGNLTVTGEEKVGSYTWCSASRECYAMDYSGFIFERVPIGTVSTRTFTGLFTSNPIGKRFGEEGFAQSIDQFLASLETLGLPVQSVHILSSDSAEAYITDGPTVRFNPLDISTVAAAGNVKNYIKSFIDNLTLNNSGTLPPLLYIDARYGNKIFYKLK